MKRLVSLVRVMLIVMGLCLFSMTAFAAEASNGYYYQQLDTSARKFYDLLGRMDLKTGTHTVDLVTEGVLEEGVPHDQEELMVLFTAGRDAFMFDNAALFYVDFEKLSITAAQTGSDYKYTLGVGRDANYFRTGFDRSNVDNAISEFNAKVQAIASAANAQDSLSGKIKAAYQGVMDASVYRLENAADMDKANYVRTPYGALVKGQSVCEGYARALKAVLDAMGIENVLVQGYYSETIAGVLQGGPHMWNYVKMDDNRWYLLDATMDDGNNQEHFLLPGTSSLLLPYQAEGLLSPNDISTEFTYPTLSPIDHKPMTKAFTITGEGNNIRISYQGKGIVANREEGYYLLGSYNGTSWYYLERLLRYTYALMQNVAPEDADLSEFGESADGFAGYAVPHAYLAVTRTAPSTTVLDTSSLAASAAYYTYDITNDDYFDLTQAGEVVEVTKRPPYIVSRGDHSSTVTDGEEFTVTITYSENLKKADPLAQPGIKLSTSDTEATVSGFVWSGNTTPNQVTFTLKVGSSFGHSINYFLYLDGLVGAESGQTPDAIAYTKYHLPKFSCPRVLSDINQIHSSIPALIADKDLSLDDWLGADGESIGENLPFELALVASHLPENTNETDGIGSSELLEQVENTGGEEVLGAQTFNISLSLCSGQVSYIQGRRVKVYVPFPEGYNAQSNVSFKAYHYNESTKQVEEIDCVVADGGIIMMCNAFSPFAVVAVKKEEIRERSVLTHVDGNGSFSQELVKVREGDTVAVTVTAKSGYRIEKVTLNSKALPIEKMRTVNDQTTVYIPYDDEVMRDAGNVLEASFVLKEISTEIPGENITVTADVPSTVDFTAPESWILGENVFTVTGEQPFIVAVTDDNGVSYTQIHANSGVSDSYTVNITADSKIVVALVGDADQDGELTNADLTQLKAAALKQTSPNALGLLIFDINGDGRITNADQTRLKAAVLNNIPLTWNASN